MPFVDADAGLSGFDGTGFDHTIVGAGAAGILLAIRLAEQGRKVLVLESGGMLHSDERQTLNRIEEVGKPFSDAEFTRKRAVGGTTIAWGGQSLPFSPLDFERRDWVEHSGWPIAFEEIDPYFARANRFMAIDTLDYRQDIDRRLGVRPLGFDPAVVDRHYAKWAPQPNFLKQHGRKLNADVTVLYNCHLARIDLDDRQAVASVEVVNFQGGRRTLPVASLILAAGGLETNRILLLNDHQVPGGLGSGSGWLGKGFMEHPTCDMGVVETDDMRRLQTSLGVRMRLGRLYSVRMSASPQWQRANRLLAVSASLLWRHKGDTFGPFGDLRQLLQRPTPRNLARVLSRLNELLPAIWVLATQGVVYKPGASAVLGLMTEQAPCLESRITLGEGADRFGQRLLRLDWRIGEQTWRTMVAFTQALQGELARLGLGRLQIYDHVRADTPNWRDYIGNVNHHMGGVRMSATADEGVVDPQLRVWGIPNLHVCSTAVFPTASHSNPTLTLLALAERLAERLGAASQPPDQR